MRLGIALRCQIPQWPGLLLLPASSCLCHPPPLSSVSLSSPVPVLTGLFHSDVTRGKLMRPGPCRSITACDDTSACALKRICGSAWCGRKIKWRRGRLLKDFLNNYYCSGDELWGVCATVLLLSLRVLWVQVAPLLTAAVSPDCYRAALGDIRGHGRVQIPTMQLPELCSQGNSEAILMLNKWFNRWKNFVIVRVRWEIVFVKFISVWLTGGYDYWMTASFFFWTYNVKQGDMEQGRGKQQSTTVKMWQNQGMCEKGGNQAVGGYLGHTGFF